MTEDAGSETSWKAPYMSYETLTNFYEKKIGANPLPPRIDAYFLDNYAGSIRPLLLATLKTTGMIGEANEVLEPLRIAARGTEARKRVLREWGLRFYATQIELAHQHATAQMLWESFSRHKISGSTLRKAVVFYLALAADVDLPVSVHFRAPKAQTVKLKRPSAQRMAEARAETSEDEDEPGHVPPIRAAGEQRTVSLGAAGTVTISVDVRWLDLSDETSTTLRRLVRELTALGGTGDGPASPLDEAEV
jgi:hypothetical protein